MNAQEAIEIHQKQLEHIKNILDLIDSGELESESSGLKQMRERYESSKIVLESAKYLHKELINEELTQHLEHTKILYLNTEYAENKAIANSKAKMIGLEGAG